MALNVDSSYLGEAYGKILTKATMGNELVDRGLIMVQTDITKDYFLPRMKVGRMLGKHKEMPKDADSKGDFNIDERKLSPKEFMAFTTFNPRAFEKIWREFQPTGELVYAELSEVTKAALLDGLAKAVDFEFGQHVISGVYADGADDTKLFDGILTRIIADVDTKKIVAPVALTPANILDQMSKIRKAIPKAIRGHKDMRFLMSIEDFDKYDDALAALPNKGADPTGTNIPRYKGIVIEALADMPENVIVATIASNDAGSNLWLGVGDPDNTTTVSVGKVENAGERYFFKMMIKADTQIMWGEYVVFYDGRVAQA